jgi:hypothetical protein
MRRIMSGLLLMTLAGCFNSSPSYRGSSPPPISAEKPGVLGLLEVTISGIGETPTASAQFIHQNGGLSAQAVTVVSDVGINLTRRAVSFYDDDVNLVRYVQAVFDITNTTSNTFANLTLYAVNVPGTTLSGTGVAGMAKADGTSIVPTTVLQASPLVTGESMVRGMKPSHAMRLNSAGNGTEINTPGLASLQVFTQSEASTVQTGAAALTPPIVGEVLQYGFVAHNLLGGRAIGASGCSTPNCNKGVVALGYKFPRVNPRRDNPFTFSLYFVVTNETTSIVTQSLEEQNDNGRSGSRAFQLGSSAEIRALAGSTLGGSNINRVCQARTAGTNAAPLEFLVPSALPCVAPTQTDLSISGLYITQPTQNVQGSVPLVVGKTALARAFVSSNIASVTSPTIRLSGWVNGVSQGTVNLTGPSTVPVPPSEGNLTASYNLALPGAWVQPGLEVVLEVDPSNTVTETNETNNRFPASGRLAFEVHAVPPWDVTLVPITYQSVTPTVNAGNASSYLDSTQRMFPVNAVTTQIHAAVSFGGNLNTGAGWGDLLDQITTLRSTEGSSRHYIGIVNPQYGAGIAGIGWVGGTPVSISWSYLPSASDIVTHEIGHNWGRDHSPCGVSGDPNYPYANARLGAFGYDATANTLKAPNSFYDVMSYCDPQWVSDHTYKAVLNYRTGGASSLLVQAGTVQAQASVPQPGLLVTGWVRGSTVKIKSVFHLASAVEQPQRSADLLLEGLSNGAVVFNVSVQVQYAPEGTDDGFFQAVIPLDPTIRLEALNVKDMNGQLKTSLLASAAARVGVQPPQVVRTGQGIQITWDRASATQVIVREVQGEVLAIDDSGTVTVTTTSNQLELLFSDGLAGRSETIIF